MPPPPPAADHHPRRRRTPMVNRVADWARVVVFLAVWTAAAVRLAYGSRFGAWDVVALSLSTGLLPGGRSLLRLFLREAAALLRGWSRQA